MGIYHNAYPYYGWDEMYSEDVKQDIFPYTFFYRENVDEYGDLQSCWEFFLEDEECGEFFTFVSLYDCEDLACGIGLVFKGSEHDVLESMKAAQYEYNVFITKTFFDASKLPKPEFHLSTLCY